MSKTLFQSPGCWLLIAIGCVVQTTNASSHTLQMSDMQKITGHKMANTTDIQARLDVKAQYERVYTQPAVHVLRKQLQTSLVLVLVVE